MNRYVQTSRSHRDILCSVLMFCSCFANFICTYNLYLEIRLEMLKQLDGSETNNCYGKEARYDCYNI